jgi:hypothetical protein
MPPISAFFTADAHRVSFLKNLYSNFFNSQKIIVIMDERSINARNEVESQNVAEE